MKHNRTISIILLMIMLLTTNPLCFAASISDAGNNNSTQDPLIINDLPTQLPAPVISAVDKKSSPAISSKANPSVNITNVPAKSTVKIFDDAVQIASKKTTGSKVTVILPKLNLGTHTLSAEVVDTTGNISARSEVFIYTVIPARPPVPVISSVDGKHSPATSYNTSPQIEISNVLPDNIIKIYDKKSVIASATATGSSVVIPLSGLSKGAHTLSAVAVNQLGKTGMKSATFKYTVDPNLTPPLAQEPVPEPAPVPVPIPIPVPELTTETVPVITTEPVQTATVSYSIATPTNQDVVATLNSDKPVIVTNNGGSMSYTFTKNGSFTFNFVDWQGNQGTAVATVSNIDKTAPVITIDPYNEAPASQSMTVTARTNEGTLNAAGHTFTQNGSFDFVATDDAGNKTTKTVTISNIVSSEYTIELDRWNIKNNGTSPKETSVGLNQALQYAKGQSFSKIIFPTGTYLIDETNPIVIDLKNTVIDLNGSTLKINTNGLEKYATVLFRDGADNVRFTNGTIRGDMDTHDYLTLSSPHQWCNGIEFEGGSNLQMDNITVTNFPGWGIYTESANNTNRFYNLFAKDTTLGAISDNGSMIRSTTQIRTSKPYDISICGGQFELGFSTGYQGYPYLTNREYTAYFYDKDMKFIEKKECIQYRKVDIPLEGKYACFVYPQATLTDSPNGYAILSNYRPPTNVKLTNCLIKDNRSLGLAFCGGQQWTIENNVFEGNGKGASPDLAVNFEDGWELTQDIIFRNNKFFNNRADLVVCSGDNLVIEGNEFTKGLYFWKRAINYKVTGNKFNGSNVTYEKKYQVEIRDNQYTNSTINTILFSESPITFTNENLIDTKILACPGTYFVNSTIKSTGSPYLKNAVMENCIFELAGAEAFNLTFKNSNINNSKLNLHTNQSFEGCNIINTVFSTHSDTNKTHFRGSQFIDSQVLYNTWGSSAETILEQCNATMNIGLPLVRLSAGKTRNLIFKNNTVLNKTLKPVIDLYDTTYTVPNGNATIEGNSFTQSNSNYVFDGVNITQGIFNLKNQSNTLTNSEVIINPKYVGNQFFTIVN